MMPKFYQTKKFKKLQDEWYAKAAEGVDSKGDPLYKDIEHSEEKLTAYSTRFCKKPDYVWDLTAAYYSMCETFLQKYTFESERSRLIWEYHSNGLSVREIAKVLSEVDAEKIPHIKVWRVINRLETIMKTTYLSESDEDSSEH